MLETVELDGIPLLTAPALEEEAGIFIAFTGRHGGTSRDGFDSLDLSFNVGDERREVLENRRRASRAADVDPGRWVTCQQVHGVRTRQVDVLDVGRGSTDFASALPRTDALVNRLHEVPTAVLTADCVPVIIVDAVGRATAVIHAGWRGTLAGIVERAASMLVSSGDTTASNMLAFIGPHIKACCMEVEAGLASAFSTEFGADAVLGTGRLDLSAACGAQLERVGIKSGNIFRAPGCTVCSSDYFSYRRQPQCGRQAAIAVIRSRG